MKVSPNAGKPAEASMLVNLPRLVTAYYTDQPDPSVPEQRVAFGTSGHRGSSFDKAFNEWHTDAEIHWFGPQGGLPNWAEPKEKHFACVIREDDQRALCLMFNAGADAVDFALPPVLPGTRWHLAVDTSRQAPQDLSAAGEEPLWEDDPRTYQAEPPIQRHPSGSGNGAQVKSAMPITTLFLDIGGVLLNNGWDHIARRKVAKHFKLEWAEMEERHRLTFETHEEGKLTFEEYLGRVVFYQKRPFSRAQFRRFMCAQSKPYPEMIELITQLKLRHGLKIAVVSNEARVVNDYRIHKFKLDAFVDFFISSCFVHIRKPDADIFRLALDVAQTPARRVVYIENTPMFVQVAEGLAIRSILHTDYKSTCAKLASFGLSNEGAIHETR
jgi:putative hydrolase of the HAD superfamily